MLTRALKQTSDHITDRLSHGIRELGQRITDLEQRTDELDVLIQALREENLTLQSHLKDFENRDRRSNLRIRGIPEVITDVQSTVTALFQKLAPSIPIKCLEMDRVHGALAPRQSDNHEGVIFV